MSNHRTDDLIQYLPALRTAIGHCSGFLGDKEAADKLTELHALISQDTIVSRSVTLCDAEGNEILRLDDVLPLHGQPMSGHVANGAWYWVRHDGYEFAYNGRRHDPGLIQNAWKQRNYVLKDDKLTLSGQADLSDDDIPF